jgi:hypothetical protein
MSWAGLLIIRSMGTPPVRMNRMTRIAAFKSFCNTTLTHRKYVNFRKKIVRSSPASYNEATAEKVWRIGAALTGLEQKNLSH